MAEQDYKFEGWLGLDEDSVNGKMVWRDYEPKPWEETDIDIQVTHSGICGSDLHTLRSGWGPTAYPVCVGHEIVGKVVRVGSQAEGSIKVGDRVGVGAQSDSCLGRNGDCEECSSGQEQYCSEMRTTFDSTYWNGAKTMGGHGLYHRCPSHFVIKIPDAIESVQAAPMLCGGATLYSPLKRHGCGPGKKVGIIGVGGLGHFGVIFARAMGAGQVIGISRGADKRDEVIKMGADDYIATKEGDEWKKKHAKSFDLIICTVSSSKIPVQDYLGLLKIGAVYCQVGNPDDGSYSVHPGPLISKRAIFTGSSIGSPNEIRQMFDMVVEKGVQVWVQERPMSDANQAMLDVEAGKPRYRYVLTN